MVAVLQDGSPPMRSQWLSHDRWLYPELLAAKRRGELEAGGLKLIGKACAQAWHVHLYQRRLTGEPYIVHPDALVRKLVELGVYHPAVLVLAYLHDAAEDQLGRFLPLFEYDPRGAIRGLVDSYQPYGLEIVTGLAVVTRTPSQTDKRVYLLEIIGRGSWEVLLVKLADRWHNIRTLDARCEHKRRPEAEMTLEVFPELLQAFLRSAPEQYHHVGSELWREIREMCQPYLKQGG